MKTIITTILVITILFLTGCKEERKEALSTVTNTSEILNTEKPSNKKTT